MKAGKAAYKTVKTTTKGGTITYTKKKAKVGTTYKFRLKGINKVNGKTVYCSDQIEVLDKIQKRA